VLSWHPSYEYTGTIRVSWVSSVLFWCGVATHERVNKGPTQDDVASGGGGEPGYNEGVEFPEPGVVGVKADHDCHRQPTAYNKRESRCSDSGIKVRARARELSILPSETMARKAMMAGKT
jgi:hypothetical protein